MYEHIEKPKENKSRAVANSFAKKNSGVKQGFGFVDNRPSYVEKRKLNGMINNRPIQMMKNFEYQSKGYSTPQDVRKELSQLALYGDDEKIKALFSLYDVNKEVSDKLALKLSDYITTEDDYERARLYDEETDKKRVEAVQLKIEHLRDVVNYIERLEKVSAGRKLIFVGGSVAIIGQVMEHQGKSALFLPLSGSKAGDISLDLARLLLKHRTALEAICKTHLKGLSYGDPATIVDYTQSGGGLRWAQAVVLAYNYWKITPEIHVQNNAENLYEFMNAKKNWILTSAISLGGEKSDIFGKGMQMDIINTSSALKSLFDDEFKVKYRFIKKFDALKDVLNDPMDLFDKIKYEQVRREIALLLAQIK